MYYRLYKFFAVSLVFCLHSPAFGTNVTEIAQLEVAGDSLIALSKQVHIAELKFGDYLNAQSTNSELLSRKFEAVRKIGSFMSDSRFELVNCAYYLYAYADGAHWPSCAGLKWNLQALEITLDSWGEFGALYRTSLGTFLNNESDSTRSLVKGAWLYIRDNLPDSCVLE